MNRKVLSLTLATHLLFSACQTTSSPTPGKVTANDSVEQLLDQVEANSEVMPQVQKYLNQKIEQGHTQEIQTALYTRILDRRLTHSHRLQNYYLFSQLFKRFEAKVIEKLLAESSKTGFELGFGAAAQYPNTETRQVLTTTLEKMIVEGEETVLAQHENVVDAILKNKLESSYPLMRQLFFTNSSEKFAQALATLSPQKAAHDFLTYLGRASIEDLRQLNQVDVDLYSTMYILRFFSSRELPLDHGQVDVLLNYVVSRNIALADLATEALYSQPNEVIQKLGLLAARKSQWMQSALVESLKRGSSQRPGSFLKYLASFSPFDAVKSEVQ